MTSGTPEQPSRRARLRAETISEIKASARRQILEVGPNGVSLRAIARELGMSPAALYRYFSSIEELIAQLCVDIHNELHDDAMREREKYAEDDHVGRLIAPVVALRRWAVLHPAEFALIFASRISPATCKIRPPEDYTPIQVQAYEASIRFASLFGIEITRYFKQQQAAGKAIEASVPLPPRSEALKGEIREGNAVIGAEIPDDEGYLFLNFWVRIYGLVAMEVFGHLPVEANLDEFYWTELHTMAGQLGVELPRAEALNMTT